MKKKLKQKISISKLNKLTKMLMVIFFINIDKYIKKMEEKEA